MQFSLNSSVICLKRWKNNHLNRMCGTYELPLTKKFFDFFEKATAPIAPKWPLPVPRQLLLSISQSLTFNNEKGRF
jgi:hypothetical protein